MPNVEEYIKQQARGLGFSLVGIASAAPSDHFERLQEWLARGFAGEMHYMHHNGDARREPNSILPDVRSVVMVGICYDPGNSDQRSDVSETLAGKVARYACGTDYHQVVRSKLKILLKRVQEMIPECRGRGVVDTAPLLERDFARRAGLGWFGKNTMLIHKRLGSYFFLGALLLDIELTPDAPHLANHCGSCTACLDACPTEAFAGPGWLDSRKCISYLTIELRGSIPGHLRTGLDDWVFGCDVCQEVCPWNRKAPPTATPEFMPRPDLVNFDPIKVLSLSEEEFRKRFRNTAVMRAGRTGLLRNAAIVLGNQRKTSALPALRQALNDADPVIRDAAMWAINQIALPCADSADSTGSNGTPAQDMG